MKNNRTGILPLFACSLVLFLKTKELHGFTSSASFGRHAASERRSVVAIKNGMTSTTTTTTAQQEQFSFDATTTTTTTTSSRGDATTIYPVHLVPLPESKTVYWDSLVPNMWENPRGIDVRIQWTNNKKDCNYYQRIASRMLDSIEDQKGITLAHKSAMEKELTASLQYFTHFCQDHFADASSHEYNARVVSSRGAFGTKCPSWHVDHVPVRWIQSLVGPGVEWVDVNEQPTTTVMQQLLAGLEEDSSSKHDTTDDADDEQNDEVVSETPQQRNRRLVPDHVMTHQAPPGQATMVVGLDWKQAVVKSSSIGEEYNKKEALLLLPPVVHKSPQITKPWQGRVLLTMDVMVPSCMRGT